MPWLSFLVLRGIQEFLEKKGTRKNLKCIKYTQTHKTHSQTRINKDLKKNKRERQQNGDKEKGKSKAEKKTTNYSILENTESRISLPRF